MVHDLITRPVVKAAVEKVKAARTKQKYHKPSKTSLTRVAAVRPKETRARRETVSTKAKVGEDPSVTPQAPVTPVPPLEKKATKPKVSKSKGNGGKQGELPFSEEPNLNVFGKRGFGRRDSAREWRRIGRILAEGYFGTSPHTEPTKPTKPEPRTSHVHPTEPLTSTTHSRKVPSTTPQSRSRHRNPTKKVSPTQHIPWVDPARRSAT